MGVCISSVKNFRSKIGAVKTILAIYKFQNLLIIFQIKCQSSMRLYHICVDLQV